MDRAVAITKDYIRWAAGAMLGSTLLFLSVSLMVQHTTVFLTLVGSVVVSGTVAYYFARWNSRKQIELLEPAPRRTDCGASRNIVQPEHIITSKKSGLLRPQAEHQHWVLVFLSYKRPSESFVRDETKMVLDGIRSHQTDFRECGVGHVHIEVPRDEPDKIVVACMVTHQWRQHKAVDSAACWNVLTHIAGSYAAVSPVKMIEGPREQLHGDTVIEAF